MKLLVGLLTLEKLPPTPLKIVQVPVPTNGLFPAKEIIVASHTYVWSDPAVAAVGLILKVIITSSVLAVQGALAIVHRNT